MSIPKGARSFSTLMIDSIDQIDLSTVSISDIRWKIGTFHPFSSGFGRDKKHWSRSGALTSTGDIEESVWYKAAEYIAKRDGELWLVDALTEWEHDHNYRCLKKAELREEALVAYSHRLFDHPRWVDYIPFNRKYRPKELETAHIIPVITACCKMRGETTQEQIEGAYQGKLSCPHCGRWSEYVIALDSDVWEEH